MIRFKAQRVHWLFLFAHLSPEPSDVVSQCECLPMFTIMYPSCLLCLFSCLSFPLLSSIWWKINPGTEPWSTPEATSALASASQSKCSAGSKSPTNSSWSRRTSMTMPWHPNHPNLPQAFMDTGWLKWTHLSVDTGRFWSRKSGLQTIHFAQGILPSHTEKHVLFLSAQRLQTLWCNQCQPWGCGSWRIHYSNAGNAGNAPTEEQALDVRISSPPGWFPNRGRKS